MIKKVVYWLAAVYLVYAGFLLIEVLDFLSLLHTKPPESFPTYDLTNVAYYIVEMVICLGFGLVFLFFSLVLENKFLVAIWLIILTLIRIILGYYLYVGTEGEIRWVPYIYKTANDLSNSMRNVFVPAQIILGLVAAAMVIRSGRQASHDTAGHKKGSRNDSSTTPQ